MRWEELLIRQRDVVVDRREGEMLKVRLAE